MVRFFWLASNIKGTNSMVKIANVLIGILFLTSCASPKIMPESNSGESFSFAELLNAPKVTIPPVQFIKATDNAEIAFREYVPETIDTVLIFYHGGGTYSAGGYQFIGDGLSKRFNCLVVTPDVRGHGDSSGDRGDTPTVEQVFDDVSLLISHVKDKYPSKPVYLGGHSSGGGLVLNYSSYEEGEKADGYLFLSPHLGFRSHTESLDNPNPFATVKKELFMKNAMFGTEGNTPAVFFNYSEDVLQRSKNIESITVNMANAITPSAPMEQVNKLHRPSAIWVGENDEIFDVNKVVSLFMINNPETYTKIIKNENHLSILVDAADFMGPWLLADAENKLK